jgi:23S rRNA (cytidine1920-2'-O)/16S rRNA (cytidine1409-2'-O)-methyltransferase
LVYCSSGDVSLHWRARDANKTLATGGFDGHSQPMSDQNSQRLDQLLVTLGLFASRSRARDAVARGTVKVAGKVVTKAGAVFGDDATIEIDDPAQDYVSRAALKLVAALDHFGLDPAGRHCLDVGASTGGFTEVLLERGAAHVTAVDVGHGQMHPRISGNPRVTNIEGSMPAI